MAPTSLYRPDGRWAACPQLRGFPRRKIARRILRFLTIPLVGLLALAIIAVFKTAEGAVDLLAFLSWAD